MIDANVPMQSRQEAVQPSLWDRLVDDLPGLAAEIARARAELARDIGETRLAALIDRGRRGLDQDSTLTDDQRRALVLLFNRLERHSFLQERGIVVTPEVLREAVRRDIEALFNVERMEARLLVTPTERGTALDPADVLADFPHVRRSVLNYGVPCFSGRRARDFDPEALARELREVVATFEPRLKRDSLRVKVETGAKTGLRVVIEGVLMLTPTPERLRLATTIDLDSGRAMTAREDR